MWRTTLLTLLLMAAAGCEGRSPAAEPDRSAPLPGAAARQQTRQQQWIAARDEARHYLDQELPKASSAERVRCPDDLLPRRSASDTALLVRLHDTRQERRHLLPWTFLQALESPQFALLQSEAPLEPPLRELAARRYVARVLVDTYSGPRLFRRKDAAKSEWDAGAFSGRLVVHDLVLQRALCQAPLRVRGNADAAPIRKRLRETTRERLTNELHQGTRAAVSAALASISSVLTLATPGADDV
jgi:hypothetical protein